MAADSFAVLHPPLVLSQHVVDNLTLLAVIGVVALALVFAYAINRGIRR